MENNINGALAPSTGNLFLKALSYEIPEDKIETIKDKNNPNARPLKYLSWAYAWSAFKQLYPDATFRIIKNPDTHLPYFYDPEAGIMVETEITANGETHPMWLFVMNGSNKAMKFVPYEYQKWNSNSKTWESKGVEAATMFDINKTLLRCLVKNMGIFGFGLTLYAGCDLSEINSDGTNDMRTGTKPQSSSTQQPSITSASTQFEALRDTINATTDVATLVSIYLDNTQVIENTPELKNLLTNRKKALQSLKAA